MGIHKFLKGMVMIRLIIFLFILSFSISYAISWKFDINSYDFYSLKTYGNKVAALGINLHEIGGSIASYNLDLFDGKTWTNIISTSLPSNKIEHDSIDENILYDMDFDKNGDIWVAGSGYLWFYKDSTWTKYRIEDSLAVYRDYTHLCIDSSNNVWVSTLVMIYDTTFLGMHLKKAIFRELYKFDGISFKPIGTVHSMEGGYGMDKGLMTAKDGKVYIHNYGLDTGNDLYIFENDEKISEIKVRYPFYTGIDNSPNYFHTYINQMYEDDIGNIWFCLSTPNMNNEVPGLMVLTPDGEWLTMTEKNGILIVWDSTTQRRVNPPIFTNINGITKLNGIYWIGGASFLGSMSNYAGTDSKIIRPDNDFLNKCTLYAYKRFQGNPYYDNDSIFNNYFYLLTNSQTHNWSGLKSVEQIISTPDGSIWMTLLDYGILRWQNQTFVDDNYQNKDDLQIYPQPLLRGTDNLVIKLSYLKTTRINIKIIDMMGRIVKQKNIQYLSSGTLSLNCDDLFSGYYILQTMIDGKIINKPLIIE